MKITIDADIGVGEVIEIRLAKDFDLIFPDDPEPEERDDAKPSNVQAIGGKA